MPLVLWGCASPVTYGHVVFETASLHGMQKAPKSWEKNLATGCSGSLISVVKRAIDTGAKETLCCVLPSSSTSSLALLGLPA